MNASQIASQNASQIAEKLGFVSGHRFSDAASPPKSVAPLGAERRILTFQPPVQRSAPAPAKIHCMIASAAHEA
jgi:hypothetical protein